jgi:AcrR family transcriptional regulator
MTADERRDAIVAAATEEFARGGLVGASVDAIARRVGVSQPYVFQLFGTKKDLFLATVASCFDRIVIAFEDAAARWEPGLVDDCDSPLMAMGLAYKKLLADRTLLMLQLQSYAACSDPDVRAAVRLGWAHLYRRVLTVSGASGQEVHTFFAEGMLLNLGAAIGLPGEAKHWALEQLEEGV